MKNIIIFFFATIFMHSASAQYVKFIDGDTAKYTGKSGDFDDNKTTNHFTIPGNTGMQMVFFQPLLLTQPSGWGPIIICDCQTCTPYYTHEQFLYIGGVEKDTCYFKVGFQPNSVGTAVLRINTRFNDSTIPSFYICDVTEIGTKIAVVNQPFFKIFPNPLVGNTLNMLSSFKTGDFNVKVLAMDAKMVYQHLVHVDDYKASVVLPALGAGVYILIITDSQTGKVYTDKLKIL